MRKELRRNNLGLTRGLDQARRHQLRIRCATGDAEVGLQCGEGGGRAAEAMDRATGEPTGIAHLALADCAAERAEDDADEQGSEAMLPLVEAEMVVQVGGREMSRLVGKRQRNGLGPQATNDDDSWWD